MTDVRKDGNSHPFSKGLLATSLSITGLPLEERYEIVREIERELDRVAVVHSKEIQKTPGERIQARRAILSGNETAVGA